MKHTCPHCGEKTISPLKKAFAGNPQSKGTTCPSCGKRSTNELKSAVFHAIVDALVLAFVVYAYICMPETNSLYYMIGAILGAFVLTHAVDAFFFKLVPAIRLDYK
ncbi:MAG: hypothetical protein ACI4JB_09195 [Porcipelethomonas sp.]